MIYEPRKVHRKNLRKGRFSQPGRIYLLTTVTNMRQPIFTDFYCARLLIQSLVKEHARAGLVDNIMEYPHWDAVWMM